MNHKAHWTFVLFILCFGNYAIAAAKKPSAHNIKELRRTYSTEVANCKKNECEDLEILEQLNYSLEELQYLYDKAALLAEENSTLKEQAKTIKKSQPVRVSKKNQCQKKEILNRKMKELGINENGDIIFSKRPVSGTSGKCWANSRNKKNATVVLCEFPLAVNILTRGGEADKLTETGLQYMFDLNGCDLIAVKRTEENSKFKTESDLSLKTCVEEWNKRGSDALMSKEQVQIMEETIQECFKHELLPVNAIVLKNVKSKPKQKSNSVR
ncbi:MAG: hypothetical protein IPM57_01695 [Oligoflexia bacterium]|nr:hypothetical protein [Oligoflexia bacterium]